MTTWSDGRLVHRARGTLRDLLRLRRYAPGVVPVPLDQLVSPLRLDIEVRARYFSFLEENLALYQEDFPRYERLARAHPYYAWFTRVALVRYKPSRAADDARLAAAFRDRLERSTRLYLNFRSNGFDARFPVSLRTAAPGAVSSSGKAVRRPFYAGDGCHRLALLVHSGAPALQPHQYRVRTDPLRSLIDNTALLVTPLRLSAADYHQFVSRGYGVPPCDTAEDLLTAVATSTPDLLPELRTVLQRDRAALDRSAPVRPAPGLVGRDERPGHE